MKKIILILSMLILTNSITLSQSRKDLINVDKLNYELLNSLFLEKINKIRDSLGIKPFVLDKKFSKVPIYQVEYMSEYDILTHENKKEFKGVMLRDFSGRVKHFNKNDNIQSAFEVCIYYPISFSTVKTYDEVVDNLVRVYMESPYHKLALTYNIDVYKFSFYSSFKLNKKKDKIYNSGFVAMYY